MARKWMAHQLHRLAECIDHENRTQTVLVEDEYGICRCKFEIKSDDFHGVGMAFEHLPDGWILGGIDYQRPNPY